MKIAVDRTPLEPWGDPNFVDVTNRLNSTETPYYVCAGTLLRLHRDGHLSPNGGDIDIWFPKNSLDPLTATRLLEDLGFHANRASSQNIHGFRDGGRFIDFEFPFTAIRKTRWGDSCPHEVISWEVQKFHSLVNSPPYHRLVQLLTSLTHLLDGRTIPTGRFKETVAKLLYRGRRQISPIVTALLNVTHLEHKVKQVEYRIPSTLVKEFEKISSGGISWYQPKEAESVLEALYGRGWRTPRSSNVWWGFAKDAPH